MSSPSALPAQCTSSSPSSDVSCQHERCPSLYNQSWCQGCLAHCVTPAASSCCFQQHISHSSDRQAQGRAEALGCAAPLGSAPDLPLNWGLGGDLCRVRPTCELWAPLGKGNNIQTEMMGKVTVISWNSSGGNSNLNKEIFLSFNRDQKQQPHRDAHFCSALTSLAADTASQSQLCSWGSRKTQQGIVYTAARKSNSQCHPALKSVLKNVTH